jgi:hypothetical protein
VLRAVDTSKPFDLTTLLGDKFKNCRVTRATPEGLTVVHDSGVARISFTLLSDEWKEQFDYDPAKAREYAQAEEEKRKMAEAKRAELNRKRELNEEQQLAEIAAAERKRLDADAQAVKEYQDGIKAANTPLAPLAPLPGDPTPNLGFIAPQPIMQTEVVVPTVPAIGDPYTPTKIRSHSYVYPGDYYGGYLPYSYYPYQPIYGHPGCVHPISPCPPSSSIPGVSSTVFSAGGMQFWFNR